VLPDAWPAAAPVAAALVIGLGVIALGWIRRRRAAQGRELAMPLEPAARLSLEQHSAIYRRMPAELRAELEPAMRGFLARVEFIGCGGLAITTPMRLVVALHAALLTRRIGIGAFGRLYSVLIYPDEFVVEQRIEDEDTGLVTEGSEVLSGQTIDTDRVIISWRDVLEAEEADGPYNVIAHELAHYLDHAWGGALSSPESESDWHDTLAAEHQALIDAVDRGEETLIDPYGAEDSAEFFCVATETLLEAPRELEQRHPQLYAQLSRFYGLDPARWVDPSPGGAPAHPR
jgi:Mlc titration factor MtfA (ptsG expression regulator)